MEQEQHTGSVLQGGRPRSQWLRLRLHGCECMRALEALSSPMCADATNTQGVARSAKWIPDEKGVLKGSEAEVPGRATAKVLWVGLEAARFAAKAA